MTKMVAGISKAAVEREATMMEASSNFIWARKLRALRAALDKAEAERDRLREAGSNAAKALRLIAGMDLMSASAVAFNAARELEAALKGESHD